DPWLRDSNEIPYGIRNQGPSAPFKSLPNTNNNLAINSNHQGVFLNQSGPGSNWLPPYYSVKADYVQNIPLQQTGRTHTFYFQRWDASPQGSAIFQDTNAVETPVVFNQENATVQANLEL
ncbi:MAG: peptidase S8, partial [Ignavibacterium album]|nr:peptidase S8 [Ignavibacterium album]